MSRLIDIDRDARRVCIIFPYNRRLLPVVRSLPERRFDGDTKNWYVPLEHLEQVIGKLADHHFKLSTAVRQYCEEHLDPVDKLLAVQDPAPGRLGVPDGTHSISQLNEQAKSALRGEFGEDIWLVGEVQSYERNRADGHAYFELVERLSPDEDPVARIRTVMFREDRQRIIDALEDAPEPIRLRDGLAVRVSGRVDLYAPQGAYQFIARDIDPGYTTGEIHQNRERILEALDEAGIRQNNQCIDWPTCPLRIGLITSYDSDAYNDFAHELQRAGFGFELTVHHANVQGARTEPSVLEGLEYFAERAGQFDVVVIVRGGGSRSDLAYFDTEAIGQAVCAHPLKIVTGVGHQRDRCLLDEITDSQKTPTAAANACVGRVSGFLERVRQVFVDVVHGAADEVDRQRQRLREASIGLERVVDGCLDVESSRLRRVRTELTYAAKDRLDNGARRLDRLQRATSATALARIEAERQRLSYGRKLLSGRRLQRRMDREATAVDALVSRLERAAVAAVTGRQRQVDDYQRRLALLDPQRVLERGFAIVRSDDGVARKPDDVPFGRPVSVRLAAGDIAMRRLRDSTAVADTDASDE